MHKPCFGDYENPNTVGVPCWKLDPLNALMSAHLGDAVISHLEASANLMQIIESK